MSTEARGILDSVRSVRQRVDDSLRDLQDEQAATTYLGALRDNWRPAEAQLRRTYTVWILTAAVFSLIHAHGIRSFTLGPVRVRSLKTVEEVLPIVMAALSYSIVMLATQVAIFEIVHDGIIERLWPSVFETDLEQPLHPTGSVLSGETSTWYFFSATISSVLNFFLVAKNMLIVFAPLISTLVAVGYVLANYSGGIVAAAAGVACLFAIYGAALGVGFISFYRAEFST